MPESIGKRISRLRQENNLTQQDLALRLAMSRVAVSHFEMDLSVPSERTITLLSGIFKLSPHRLVEGTTYPAGKAERLPLTTCCYTALEVDLALLANDLEWLERLEGLPGAQTSAVRAEMRAKWSMTLECWQVEYIEPWEKIQLHEMQTRFYKVFFGDLEG